MSRSRSPSPTELYDAAPPPPPPPHPDDDDDGTHYHHHQHSSSSFPIVQSLMAMETSGFSQYSLLANNNLDDEAANNQNEQLRLQRQAVEESFLMSNPAAAVSARLSGGGLDASGSLHNNNNADISGTSRLLDTVGWENVGTIEEHRHRRPAVLTAFEIQQRQRRQEELLRIEEEEQQQQAQTQQQDVDQRQRHDNNGNNNSKSYALPEDYFEADAAAASSPPRQQQREDENAIRSNLFSGSGDSPSPIHPKNEQQHQHLQQRTNSHHVMADLARNALGIQRHQQVEPQQQQEDTSATTSAFLDGLNGEPSPQRAEHEQQQKKQPEQQSQPRQTSPFRSTSVASLASRHSDRFWAHDILRASAVTTGDDTGDGGGRITFEHYMRNHFDPSKMTADDAAFFTALAQKLNFYDATGIRRSMLEAENSVRRRMQQQSQQQQQQPHPEESDVLHHHHPGAVFRTVGNVRRNLDEARTRTDRCRGINQQRLQRLKEERKRLSQELSQYAPAEIQQQSTTTNSNSSMYNHLAGTDRGYLSARAAIERSFAQFRREERRALEREARKLESHFKFVKTLPPPPPTSTTRAATDNSASRRAMSSLSSSSAADDDIHSNYDDNVDDEDDASSRNESTASSTSRMSQLAAELKHERRTMHKQIMTPSYQEAFSKDFVDPMRRAKVALAASNSNIIVPPTTATTMTWK